MDKLTPAFAFNCIEPHSAARPSFKALSYRRTGARKPVPVSYFKGSVAQAVLAAGQANSKAKLQMTEEERMNFAWRFVVADAGKDQPEFSKKELSESASVSERTVANMRAAAKVLGDEVDSYASWREAQMAAKGKEGRELTEEERQEWKEAQAGKWAGHLAKHFGAKLANNPEIAAMALDMHLGRRLPDVVYALSDYLPESEGSCHVENQDF